jgi:hypothetical protein
VTGTATATALGIGAATATIYAMTPAGLAASGGAVTAVLAIGTIAAWPILMLCLMISAAYTTGFTAMRRYREMAETTASRILHSADPDRMTVLKNLLANTDPRYAGIRRLAIIRIANATMQFDARSRHIEDEHLKAIGESYRELLFRIVDEAGCDSDRIDEEIELSGIRQSQKTIGDMGTTIEDIDLDVVPRALPELHGDVAAMRLATTAEKALAIDPELTDANGGRLDNLIRNHLPHLLAIHQDMISAPGADKAEARKMLDEGLEIVAKSVEEAIQRLQGRKADDLRTQIAFLRTRRGDETLSLRIPEQSK